MKMFKSNETNGAIKRFIYTLYIMGMEMFWFSYGKYWIPSEHEYDLNLMNSINFLVIMSFDFIRFRCLIFFSVKFITICDIQIQCLVEV